MKRAVIVFLLLLGIVCASYYSSRRVNRAWEGCIEYMDGIEGLILEENKDALTAQTEAFRDYWEEEENVLVFFVRHSQVDEISRNVARLPDYAKYGYYADLASELAGVRWQIEHIWKSEKAHWRNIF